MSPLDLFNIQTILYENVLWTDDLLLSKKKEIYQSFVNQKLVESIVIERKLLINVILQSLI